MKAPRVLFGAPKSGSGKTTIVCGILQALVNRGLSPAALKCGPDYIDPMFHREVIGAKSANIDLFFTNSETSKSIFAQTMEDCDLAIIEGVMGYFDGLGGTTDQASAYHVATVLDAPAILILDGKGASLSICAMAKGFADFRENSHIAGVILNKCTAMQHAMVAPLLEEIGLKSFGFVPNLPEFSLESRHLGLITAQEVTDLKAKLQGLANQLEHSLDLDGILALASSASDFMAQPLEIAPVVTNRPRIAVAMDKAFCFYYGENLDILRKLGAELLYFSPLSQEKLPDCDGLYLGGGYPELYGAQLAANKTMLQSIASALSSGLPTLAECGGFMYLHQSMTDNQGETHNLVGAISGNCHNLGKLARFGYVNLIANQPTLLCQPNDQIPAHEFHYYDSTDNGAACHAQKPIGKRNWDCVHGSESLFAGYPHLYFYSNLDFPRNFVRKSSEYRSKYETF